MHPGSIALEKQSNSLTIKFSRGFNADYLIAYSYIPVFISFEFFILLLTSNVTSTKMLPCIKINIIFIYKMCNLDF